MGRPILIGCANKAIIIIIIIIIITVPSTASFDPTRQLCRDGIKFTAQGAVLRIKWSKTVQHHE